MAELYYTSSYVRRAIPNSSFAGITLTVTFESGAEIIAAFIYHKRIYMLIYPARDLMNSSVNSSGLSSKPKLTHAFIILDAAPAKKYG